MLNQELIQKEFESLRVASLKRCANQQEYEEVIKAFEFANEAHKGVRRRSGEPYIIHPIAVAKIVVQEIGLGYKSIVTALLHDIGMYIRGSDHQLHSNYIILHSDIFGLTKDDMQIISLVAKYHRGSAPNQSDSSFTSLPRANRIEVLKLAAILRVADALDRSHSQKEIEVATKIQEDNLILRVKGGQNLNLEKIALLEKGDLFESIFGYKLILEGNGDFRE